MLGAGRLSLPSSPRQLRVDLGGTRGAALFLDPRGVVSFVCIRLQTKIPDMVVTERRSRVRNAKHCAFSWHVRAVLAATIARLASLAARSGASFAENACALRVASRRGGPPAGERVR